MNKKIYINIEETIKEEEDKRRKALYGKGSTHQMVQNATGQFVDAHIDGHQLTDAEIGRGQVEVLLQLQIDSDTLRIIENVETENEVIDRIQWGKKKKKSPRAMY